MHKLGWYNGSIVAATDRNGSVWIGFKCWQCGKVSGKHIAPFLERNIGATEGQSPPDSSYT